MSAAKQPVNLCWATTRECNRSIKPNWHECDGSLAPLLELLRYAVTRRASAASLTASFARAVCTVVIACWLDSGEGLAILLTLLIRVAVECGALSAVYRIPEIATFFPSVAFLMATSFKIRTSNGCGVISWLAGGTVLIVWPARMRITLHRRYGKEPWLSMLCRRRTSRNVWRVAVIVILVGMDAGTTDFRHRFKVGEISTGLEIKSIIAERRLGGMKLLLLQLLLLMLTPCFAADGEDDLKAA